MQRLFCSISYCSCVSIISFNTNGGILAIHKVYWVHGIRKLSACCFNIQMVVLTEVTK